MIETICSNCGNKKSFEDSFAGKTFKCPSCGNPVTIQNVGSILNTEPVSQTNSFAEEIARAEAKARADQERAFAEREAMMQLAEKQKKIQQKRVIIIVAIVIFIILLFKLWSSVLKPIYTHWKIENYIEDNYKLLSELIIKDNYTEIKGSIENWKFSDSNEINSKLYAYPSGDLAASENFKGKILSCAMDELDVCKGLKGGKCDEIYLRCFKDFDDKEKFWKESNPMYKHHARYADSLKKILFAELKSKEIEAVPEVDNSQSTNSNNEQMPSGSGTYTVVVEKSHFYSNPDPSTKKKSYLVYGQSGNYEEVVNGFVYVTYTNSNNVSTSGWLLIDDLEIAPDNTYDAGSASAAASN